LKIQQLEKDSAQLELMRCLLIVDVVGQRSGFRDLSFLKKQANLLLVLTRKMSKKRHVA
jgi:hypothetical protein